jgi:hypothetical protein
MNDVFKTFNNKNNTFILIGYPLPYPLKTLSSLIITATKFKNKSDGLIYNSHEFELTKTRETKNGYRFKLPDPLNQAEYVPPVKNLLKKIEDIF